jgi:TP901 family phage tail tape measure protein
MSTDSERYDLFGNVGLDSSAWDTGIAGMLKSSGLVEMKWLAVGGAVGAVASGLVSCATKAANFESAMANIETVVGPGQDSFLAKMGDDLASLSQSMPFGQTELANTLYDIVSYGVPASDAMTVLKTSAETAVGGFAQVNETFGLFASIVKGYGLDWKDVSDIADKMFKVAASGATTIGQLSGAMGGTIPFARQLGIRLNEVYAVMATLPGVTGTTSEAANQLTSAMTAMLDPNSQMVKLYRELGVLTGEEFVKKIGGLQQAFFYIKEYAEKHNIAVGTMLGRKEAQLAFFNITGSQAKEYANKLNDMANSTGLAAEAFKTEIDTTANSWKIIGNELELFMRAVGDKIIPTAKEFFQLLNDVVKLDFGGMAENVVQFFNALGENFKPYVLLKDWYNWIGDTKAVNFFQEYLDYSFVTPLKDAYEKISGVFADKTPLINRQLLLQKEAANDAAERGLAPLWEELKACDDYMLKLNTSTSRNSKVTEEAQKVYSDWVKSLRSAAREQLPALNFQLNELSGIMATAGGVDELGFAQGLDGYVKVSGDLRGEWNKIPDIITDASYEVDELNKKTNKGTGYVDNMNKNWIKTAGYILNIADNLFDANSKAGKLVDTAQSIALGFATGGVTGAVVAAAAAIAGPLKDAADEFFNGFKVNMHWGENYVADPTTNYQQVYDEAIKRGDDAMAEWAIEMLNKQREPMHTGGFPRTAHSGYLASSEVDVRMLKNEMVLRPEATDKFGAGRLLDFNKSLDPSALGGQRPIKVVFHNATKQSWAEIVDESIYPRMKEKERRFEVAGNPY